MQQLEVIERKKRELKKGRGKNKRPTLVEISRI